MDRRDLYFHQLVLCTCKSQKKLHKFLLMPKKDTFFRATLQTLQQIYRIESLRSPDKFLFSVCHSLNLKLKRRGDCERGSLIFECKSISR